MPKVKSKTRKPKHPTEAVAKVYCDKNLLRLINKETDDVEQDEQELEKMLIKSKKREIWVEKDV